MPTYTPSWTGGEVLGAKHRHHHNDLGKEHVNVKAFGALGDGVADDTAEIQAAVDAAAAASTGPAVVYFPAGYYKVTSTITLDFADSQGITLTGPNSSNPDPGSNRVSATLLGSFSGPILRRNTTALGDAIVVLEHLGFRNTHASGQGAVLNKLQAASSIRNCYFQANKGVSFIQDIFNVAVANCTFQPGTASWPVGSWGIYGTNHVNIYSCDFNGFDHGIRLAGAGHVISGGRVEVNRTGVMLGQDEAGVSAIVSRTSVHGLSMEGNDTGINLFNCQGVSLTGVGIHGHAGSPSVGSLIGIDIGGCYAIAIMGVVESGTHVTNFIRQITGTFNISFISVWSTTAWSLSSSNVGLMVANCTPETTRFEHPVIATGSLPAAGAAQNGRIVIEDAGAGNRNLIIYGGGERFRIDGGAAI